MASVPRVSGHLFQSLAILLTLVTDVIRYLWFSFRSPSVLAAENIFLRKQLAVYQERHVKPTRVTNADRSVLVWIGRWFDWRHALIVVQPDTFIRWHRQGFRLFWRWKSQPGRPPIPLELQGLIRQMTRENPTWGQERIANELLLKLGLRVSPRTVRKYMPKRLTPGPGTRVSSQRWSAFVRNHAQAIAACDFCVAMTVTFRMLHVFVVIEHASRRLLHIHATAHPTAAWTLQQLREAIPSDRGYRFLIHDRDSIFSQVLDQSIHHLGLRVLKTPPRAPQANAICERLIGTLRHKCLDFVIPLTAHHLRRLLQDWVGHYNTGRPHMSLGPGIPQPPSSLPVPPQEHRHRVSKHLRVVGYPILGGLHHEYQLEAKAV
jgi:putative transposase